MRSPSKAICFTAVFTTTLCGASSKAVAAEYSLSASWVKSKSHFFEDFQAQRKLLFELGYPNTDTSLEQTLDSRSDSYAITAGYHYNRYIAIKASYLGKNDYSLKSEFNHSTNTSDGSLIVAGQDTIKSKIIAARFGITAELPLLYKLAVGTNIGMVLSRINTARTIQGSITSNKNTTLPASTTPISANKTTSDYEANIYSGLYFAYTINPQWKIISHWNRYFNQGIYDIYPSIVNPQGDIISLNMGENHHIDSYGIGVEYRFNGHY